MRDDNVGADGVVDVYGLGLPRLPGARHEGVRLAVGHRLIHQTKSKMFSLTAGKWETNGKDS